MDVRAVKTAKCMSTKLHSGVELLWAMRILKAITHFRNFGRCLRSSMNPSGDVGWKQCPCRINLK